MISSSLAAFGGIILAARMNTGQPSAGASVDFDAITAAVLGGVAMTGGVGTIAGTFVGLLILQSFNNGLLILNVNTFWQDVANGLLLIFALAFDYFRQKKRR